MAKIITKLTQKIKPRREKRIDCIGGCGRRVLQRYNPSMYCRKCTRKNKIKAARVDSKRNR